MIANGVLYEFKNRIEAIRTEAEAQEWFNIFEFNAIIERFEY
jgi:hypothetical protein